MKSNLVKRICKVLLTVSSCVILITSSVAYAGEVLEDPVKYPYIGSKEELKEYIDNDGDFVLDENVTRGETSRTYSIEISEPGTLVFCPIDIDGSWTSLSELRVYSNKTLTSRINNTGVVSGDSDPNKFGEAKVEPGTYYFHIYNGGNGSGEHFVVFLGFIPDAEESLEAAVSDETESFEADETIESLKAENESLKEELKRLSDLLEDAGIEIDSLAVD